MKKQNTLHYILTAFGLSGAVFAFGQNPLYIPPVLTGPSFDLQVQAGTTNFFGTACTTYGINGNLLAPTVVVNKGDVVTLNVTNNLNESTTMHWHGLHVAPEHDGGPHQEIMPASTWSPSFEILNQAGTFWYHPHGHGKTDRHVSKGIAGFFLIHDAEEASLGLPLTYGVDDFPLVVQSKAFDVLGQISVSTDMDTVVMVNGTLNPYLEIPAQVVRFRLLNGSSLRAYHFGFSDNRTFFQISTDGGLTPQANALTRITLAPGERTDILIDCGGQQGQTIQLRSYASELVDGIYGAAMVGSGPDTIHDYADNFLNGADFDLLELRVVPALAGAITSIPTTLAAFNPFSVADMDRERTFILDTVSEFVGMTPNLAEGPFGINYELFDMMVVNDTVMLGATEVWTLINKTHIAHPFHIHDIQFNIIEKSGVAPPVWEQGWKDVVLVPPHDSARFITRFTTFANETVPYMYHCHLLHHEDDGMMGSFIVRDTSLNISEQKPLSAIRVYPNPANNSWSISGLQQVESFRLLASTGQEIALPKLSFWENEVLHLDARHLAAGMYYLEVNTQTGTQVISLMK